MMKFEVDFMLGKLARALRMLGFDTKYRDIRCSSSPLHDAMKEGRILLTRSHNLPKSPTIFVIESEDVETQLKELDSHFNLKSNVQPFTRCLVCNTLLTMVEKSEVLGKVPFYVYQTQTKFAHCKGCNKFYWKGTHYKAMENWIKNLFDFS